MIRILLLALSVFSLGSAAEVTLDQLKWQPNLITKESILATSMDPIPDEPPLFTDIPQLVFISEWSQRSWFFVQINAERLNYVTPIWFPVIPNFHFYEKERNAVEIVGTNFDPTFIKKLRKLNPDMKIVPSFEFTKFAPKVIESFVRNEVLMQRTAQIIANFCHEYGFDGAVIACPTLLSKGILFEERFAEKDLNQVDLYTEFLEAFEQLGNVIRKNNLIAIFSMPPPVTPSNLESETRTSALTPQFSRQIMNAYDFVHIWANADLSQFAINRHYIHDKVVEENIKFFDNSPKLLVGIDFYGHEFPLDAYLKGESEKPWESIGYDRYLEVLGKNDAIFTFNEVNKEHELISISANAFIIFPSLTQLEYRIAHVKQHPGVGIAISEYGHGLDYFTNLV